MKKRLLSILSIVLLLLTLLPANVVAQTVETPLYRNDVVIVQYDKVINEKAINAIEKEHGLSVEKVFKKDGLKVYKINKNKTVEEMIEKLNKKNNIVFAEPDYIIQAITGDYYSLLWGFENSNDIDIDAPEAWEITKGSSDIIVAVIDTGVQQTHEDLHEQLLPGTNYTTEIDESHGTHVAGTIAAMDNGFGVIGVAPHVKILPLQFLGPDGGSTSDAISAIEDATGVADIINASWGGGGYSIALKNAIEDFGGPFVAAAGNDRKNTDRRAHYPSSYDSPNIISVAAVDRNGNRARFSNYGSTTVDVGAPGVDIASTYEGNSYVYMSGTSMAAPHVAGTLALMMSVDSSASTEELINILYQSVEPLDSLQNKTVTGGMINANNALLLMNPVEDTTAPTIVSSSPTNGNQNVPVNQSIEITYSEPIEPSTSYNDITLSGIEFNQSISGRILTLTPTTDFAVETDYSVFIPSDAVKDAANNSAGAYNLDFKTESESITPPTTIQVVTSISPTNKARKVSVTTDILLAVNNVTVVDQSKIKLVDKNLAEVTITITLTNDKLTLSPDSDLKSNMRYTVTILEGAFDIGNDVSAPYSSVFTTER
jgi:subtilisin family serine protease